MLFGQMQVSGRLYLVNKHSRPAKTMDPRKPQTIDVFIGRPSPLGNKYIRGVHGDRDTVCDKYDRWIRRRIKKRNTRILAALNGIIDKLDAGHDVALVCFCHPQRCHGLSVIKQVNRLRKRA